MYSKFKASVLRHCDAEEVLALMARHLLPILTFSSCMWPFIATIVKEILAFQARLLVPLLEVEFYPSEGKGEFIGADADEQALFGKSTGVGAKPGQTESLKSMATLNTTRRDNYGQLCCDPLEIPTG